MTWLSADLLFPAVFSYRLPACSPTMAMSSPVPGPSVVKLALVATAIERTGSIKQGSKVFDAVKGSLLLIRPPSRIAIYRAFTRRLKLMRNGVIDRTFATREYVHFDGPLRIFLEVEEDQADLVASVLPLLRYIGTSDSIVSCQLVGNIAPDQRGCARPIKLGEQIPPGILLPLRDIKPDAHFDQVNPYAARGSEALIPVTYIAPLKVGEKGGNWTLYERTNTQAM